MNEIEDEDEFLARKQAELDERRAQGARAVQAVPAPSTELQAAIADLGRGPVRAVKEPEELDAIRARTAAEVERRHRTPDLLESWLSRSGVGKRHRRLTIDPTLIPAGLHEWAGGFPGSLETAGAILAGNPGTGKTTAAVWLMAQAYMAGQGVVELDPWGDGQVKRVDYCAPEAVFVSASDLFSAVFAKKSLERYERCALLVIDDWGMPYETEWPLATIDGIIDRRWRELRATLVTTNLRPTPRLDPTTGQPVQEGASLQERYGRVLSRICDSDGAGLVLMVRDDLRRRRA